MKKIYQIFLVIFAISSNLNGMEANAEPVPIRPADINITFDTDNTERSSRLQELKKANRENSTDPQKKLAFDRFLLKIKENYGMLYYIYSYLFDENGTFNKLKFVYIQNSIYQFIKVADTTRKNLDIYIYDGQIRFNLISITDHQESSDDIQPSTES